MKYKILILALLSIYNSLCMERIKNLINWSATQQPAKHEGSFWHTWRSGEKKKAITYLTEEADKASAIANQAYKDFFDLLKINASAEFLKLIQGVEKSLDDKHILVQFISQVNTSNIDVNKGSEGTLPEPQSASLNQVTKYLIDYVQNHKTKFLFFTCLGLYCVTQLSLLSIQHKLHDLPNWSLKRHRKLFDQSTESILTEIQNSYCDMSNPTDCISPLMAFSEDIADEKYYLQKYQSVIGWIKALHLQSIFFFDKKLYKNSSQRIEYLRTIKKEFLDWMSQCKLKQIEERFKK